MTNIKQDSLSLETALRFADNNKVNILPILARVNSD